ncbi:polysaccharide deacetylase family protein [Danxiaibacter flavus]|uniref:Polysaccharide deacetylase family protein n=1 Tax=Danxiaibacter flavus TaxID=3049108 RepID=A0ABV3ZCR3_9BACT|nr:polysaccharide deacetylase family protein [Chitinophagaceae bacterium DXS]
MKKLSFLLFCFVTVFVSAQTSETTYAEKLGFPKGAKVLILHVDDAGMSFDSNEGAITAMTKGVANSCSVMMPCPWVPAFVAFLNANPQIDAGLHLTLNAEWKNYRWVPLAGKTNVPGLTDTEGNLWKGVGDVVQHASADEVYKEIKAQLDRAITMGMKPTHLDSHMGTLFASPEFLKQYIRLGIENQIPVMFPAGKATLIQAQQKFSDQQMNQFRQVGKNLWDAGLPVLDDLHNESYGWTIPDDVKNDDKKLQAYKTQKYIEGLKSLQPGVTMMIMHCTATTEVFKEISDSGPVRRGDMLAMIDPALKKALQDEHIILTTWRELKERRDKVK